MATNQRSTDVAYGAWRRATLGRMWIAVVLILMDLALVAIAAVAWGAADKGSVSGMSIASISLMGGCAIAGIPTLALVALANLLAVRSRRDGRPESPARRLAAAGLTLAVARLVVLVVAAVTVAIAGALDSDSALTDACTVAVAGFDALLALLVAWRTGRAIRPPAV